MASLEDCFNAPSKMLLDQYNRDQLLKIAEYYKIAVGDKQLKENVRAILKANLQEFKVFVPLEESPVLSDLAGAAFPQDSLPESGPELVLNFVCRV